MRASYLVSLLVPIICWADLPASQLYDDEKRGEFSELSQYEQQIKQALTFTPPVLNLLPLSGDAAMALSAALRDAQVVKATGDIVTGRPYRNEVFTVRPYTTGDLAPGDSRCAPGGCWTVELFHFTTNSTTIAVVDPRADSALSVRTLPQFQPEVPAHLAKLAIAIAQNSPEIAKLAGRKPQAADFVMSGTKSALQKTRCERSQHLCVAPTLVVGEHAVWSIVDLVDGRVVGTRTTRWNSSPPAAFTEQQLRDQHLLEQLCERSVSLSRNGWSMSYQLTSSDGLEVRDATFGGESRLKSAKNVDWHVSYSDSDGFGYSDAVGCPLFSAAAVVPARMPTITDLRQGDKVVGFELQVDYISKLWPLPCNYFYEQRFQFFDDGRFRVAVANVGRGCGEPGVYRPVIRIELPHSNATFSSWDGERWKRWLTEGWEQNSDRTPHTPEGYRFRIASPTGHGVYMIPGRGQFGDGGRGDHAFTYLVRSDPGKTDEGALDLPTIGPCCNGDYRQGPERFIQTPPESVENRDFVIWYVPQLTNQSAAGQEYCWGSTEIIDGRIEKREFPCIAGPLFVPISQRRAP